MADEARPTSRRARREAAERAQGGGQASGDQASSAKASGGKAAGEPTVSRPPEIQGGFAYTSEIPTSDVAASGDAVSGVPVEDVAAAFAELEPEDETGSGAESTDSAADQGKKPEPSMSRKERRRLERLENPVETWTAEEEARHTGQVPAMTPDAISHQEETARQKAAQAQQEAVAATGGTPKVKRTSLRTQQATSAAPSADPQQPTAPGSPQAIPPGGGRPVPMPTAQGAPAPHAPTRGADPMVVPQLAGNASPGGGPGGPPQAAGTPQAPGSQADNFESLVAGGLVPPGSKPPTVAVPEVKTAFQSPGVVQAPGVATETGGTPAQPATAQQAAQGQGPYAPPGQASGQMVVPGTGTLQTTSGTLRSVPGTGAVPRPMVEIHPAGGIRHFGWPQLLLLAAAAFALGVVIWNVAANGS